MTSVDHFGRGLGSSHRRSEYSGVAAVPHKDPPPIFCFRLGEFLPWSMRCAKVLHPTLARHGQSSATTLDYRSRKTRGIGSIQRARYSFDVEPEYLLFNPPLSHLLVVFSAMCQNCLDLWVQYVSRSSSWDEREQAALELLSGLLGDPSPATLRALWRFFRLSRFTEKYVLLMSSHSSEDSLLCRSLLGVFTVEARC